MKTHSLVTGNGVIVKVDLGPTGGNLKWVIQITKNPKIFFVHKKSYCLCLQTWAVSGLSMVKIWLAWFFSDWVASIQAPVFITHLFQICDITLVNWADSEIRIALIKAIQTVKLVQTCIVTYKTIQDSVNLVMPSDIISHPSCLAPSLGSIYG